MPLFQKPKYAILPTKKKKELPSGVWIKCEGCGEAIYNKELERNLKVCPKCSYHFKLNFKERLALLTDKESFQEWASEIESTNPLQFPQYQEKKEACFKKTGLKDAVIIGEAKLFGHKFLLGILEFAWIGGSMGVVVGEKVTLLLEKGAEEKLPVVIVSSSGGARMQEGVISLMQMAKTAAAVAKLNAARGLYISLLTNPTTGGVSASFALLGDIIIAEPGALIGFAGPRVIEQTIKQSLPEGFQRSEFLLEHGMIDIVVPRKELKEKIAKIFELFGF
jgi:acetyl-CoA carboxylase carboxyl transferase subunit beta